MSATINQSLAFIDVNYFYVNQRNTFLTEIIENWM